MDFTIFRCVSSLIHQLSNLWTQKDEKYLVENNFFVEEVLVGTFYTKSSIMQQMVNCTVNVNTAIAVNLLSPRKTFLLPFHNHG